MSAQEMVRQFAIALDNNDFEAAGVHLAQGCRYDSPRGVLVGRDAVLGSYAAAAGSKRDVVDRVVNRSNVVERGENRFAIGYTDRVHAGRLVHTYRCEQHIVVCDGQVNSVTHVEIDGERPALEAFFSRISKRVVVVVYPGCVLYEVMLAVELIGEHVRIEMISPEGEPVTLATGFTVGADASFAGAPRANVVGVLIPGGDPGDLIGNTKMSTWLRQTYEAGASVGAICAGPLLLGEAGLLRGRKFTHGYGSMYADKLAPFWAGAQYVDAAIVQDGRLLTAQPQAHVAFGVRFAERLGLLDTNSAARALAFYRGESKSRRATT